MRTTTAAPAADAAAAAVPRTLNAGVFSTCGARGPDKMEDRHVVVRALNDIEGAHLVGVFDGRGIPPPPYHLAH
jgi:hypothetical protein